METADSPFWFGRNTRNTGAHRGKPPQALKFVCYCSYVKDVSPFGLPSRGIRETAESLYFDCRRRSDERFVMREMTRPLYVLLLLQGACLGIGLWLHDRYLVSASKWSHEASVVEKAGAVVQSSPKAESAAAVEPQMPIGMRTDEPRVEDFVRMMPSASLIAFVWTWGLQSVIASVLLSRVHVEHSRRVLKSEAQTLQNTRDLVRTRDAVIFGLAKLAESRDPETGYHLERISLYSTRLASTLSRMSRYRSVVTPAFVRLIGISSALHDIGKVGIEDSVLLKPGAFDSSERFRMQLHAQVGSNCICEIERRLGTSNFLEMAREIAHWHHERWDGTGYPDGLVGEQIPLAARIVAIADVYDALSVRRVYKEALPHEECVAIIRQEAGRQFDPDLVRVFLQIEPQFREIARQFAGNSAFESGSSQKEHGRQHLTPEQEMTLLATLSECGAPLQLEQVAPNSA